MSQIPNVCSRSPIARSVDLTVIGPELPLSRGVVDVFEAAGRPVVGPTRAAAQLECSKAFAKAFMARHGVPTADYAVAGSEAQATEILAIWTLRLSRRLEGRWTRRR